MTTVNHPCPVRKRFPSSCTNKVHHAYSLKDIAAHFERLARGAARGLDMLPHDQAILRQTQVGVWRDAAEVVRKTTLKGRTVRG
jgi:hypothetical protein